MGQPWMELWAQFPPQNAVQRRMKVADLLSQQRHGWDNEKLIQVFGFHGALFIAITYPNDLVFSNRRDRLLFTPAKNGEFSIKGAYKLLTQGSHTGSSLSKLFNAIWYTPHILPRARVFLWKIAKNALPVEQVLCYRLNKQPQGCSLCGCQTENVVHTLFKCPVAQQVWFCSEFGLRTENLPDDSQQVLAMLFLSLSQQQRSAFSAIAWHLWKARCKEVFEGKKVSPFMVLSSASNLTFTMRIAPVAVPARRQILTTIVPNSPFICYSDASWVSHEEGGVGLAAVVFTNNRLLVQYELRVTAASSPFHSEVLALSMAVQMILSNNINDCCFLTDCKELFDVLNGLSGVTSVEWRAYDDTLQLLDVMTATPGFNCAHINRDDNHLADSFAKFARFRNVNCTDYTFPTCCIPDFC
ncbi:Ribonuclease H-like superfamily protein [Rhynchospora pubera]|uniref:Ribonuclease H-like superfamily protein n=1 Tax=Rhynchospora pubera TaxID=906938 RepID=A0AAV8H511_9POAL|nr:Ribonuclease H-like superfamily protein [Rhynchospora pubera]